MSQFPKLHAPVPQQIPIQLPSTSPPPLSETPPLGNGYSGTSYQRYQSPPVQQQSQFHTSAEYGSPYGSQAQGGYGGYGSYASTSSAPSLQQGDIKFNPNLNQGNFQSYGQPQGQRQVQPDFGNWMQNQMGSWGMNDATTAMGVQFGKQAFGAGQQYVEKTLWTFLPVSSLRHAFNVSNMYVLNKIRLVLFPWRHKKWARLVKRNDTSGQAEGYRAPRDDLNCPDLYIPGLHQGLSGRFNPSTMGSCASKALAVLIGEFAIVKFFLYLLGIPGEAGMVEMLSYQGYKFIGIIVCLLARLFGFGGFMYWSIFFYVFSANAFFLLRSLRYILLPESSNPVRPPPITAPSPQGYPNDMGMGMQAGTGTGHGSRTTRLYFLTCIAGSQLFSMWVLAWV